jgi:hypothetical protein
VYPAVYQGKWRVPDPRRLFALDGPEVAKGRDEDRNPWNRIGWTETGEL